MSYKYGHKCTAQLKFSHEKTQETAVVTHTAIKKCPHIYTSILATYAIYTAFKQTSMMGGPQSPSVCC
jgi:hypothetical protein